MAALIQTKEQITTAVAQEDEVRAQLYRLLARLLARPAARSDIELVAAIGGDESDLGRALAELSRVAGTVEPAQVEREYHDLFIGLGRGELLPFGSYYLTGFLHEKPLARLRDDMAGLGIERDPAVKEPEDHIAAELDMMAGLILGDYGEPAALSRQKRFFADHVGPWAGHFFKDLEKAKAAVFYGAVGGVGRVFMDVEEAAFSME
ncbi:TorD/DmsD family molecular chaperone [Microbaculum sp. FT89]|uniref:TorD/DmsD family molecular chaperone n=1 Tax=Microbaculum sp. FT89 TaxID=3447298 RepID=UPI003F539D69